MDLRGLKTINLITRHQCAYEDFNAALDVIGSQAARRLREAGLRVETEDSGAENAAPPHLQVTVECSSTRPGADRPILSLGPDAADDAARITGYVFLVHIELFQRVALVRNRTIERVAATYRWTGDINVLSRSRPFSLLRQEVMRGIDSFIGNWRDADHPQE